MEDAEIVRLYWNRDEAAISATAERYGNYCYAIAYQILQCREDAQECVSDTYWKAWLSIPPQRPDRLAAYLGKITRNLSLDRRRRLNAQKRGNGQTELAQAYGMRESTIASLLFRMRKKLKHYLQKEGISV